MTFEATVFVPPETNDPLVTALKAFDRKERPFLVQACLGLPSRQLDQKFLHTVSSALGVEPSLGPNAWWTTDFHFDWLAGALALFYDPALKTRSTSFANNDHGGIRLVTGSQEDADLLIADNTRLVILEAKRYGSWQVEQVKRKFHRTEHLRLLADRLAEQSGRPRISVYLLFSSPQPKHAEGAPKALQKIWGNLAGGNPPWIPLQGLDETPPMQAHLTRRCHHAGGAKPKPAQDGDRWFIDTVALP